MNSKDLVAGQTYYIEARNSAWYDLRFLDIANRNGQHRARLEETTHYRATTKFEQNVANLPSYVPAERGPYRKVTVFGGTNERLNEHYRKDRVEFVRITAIRGVWDDVVRDTQATLDRWAQEDADRKARELADDERRAALVARAAQAGLEVRSKLDVLSRAHTFVIKEEDLKAYLDGMESFWSSLS